MKLRFSHVIIGVLTSIVVVLVAFQFISLGWISEKVNALVNDNDASSWNSNLFEQIKFNAIIAILLFLGIIIFLIYKLKSLQKWTDNLGHFIIEQFHKCIDTFKNNSFNQNITLLVIIVIGGFARFMLYNDPITYDEAFSANQYSSSSFLNIISNYNYPNNHVLYNLINKFSGTFIGSQEWAIRLPAYIAGMLCLPFTYILGMQLFENKRKATILVSLFAFSPLLIEYSVLARGYSLIWLLTILSLIALNSYLKTVNQKYLTLLVIFSALSIWAIPIAIIPFICIVLYLALHKGKTTSLKIALATLTSAFILYLPILLTYGLNLSSKINLGIEESYSRLFNYHIEHSALDFYYNFIMTKPIYFGFILIILVIAIFRKSTSKNWILLAAAAIVLLIVFQKTIPPARVWSVVLIFSYIPISDVIGDLFNQKKQSFIVFLPLIIFIIQVSFYQKKSFIMTDFRYENAEEIVSSISEPCSIVCQFPMEAPIQYYWSEYLRDKNDFNVKSSNTFIAVSTKHNQNILEICKQWEIDRSQVELIEKGDSFEMYQYKTQTK